MTDNIIKFPSKDQIQATKDAVWQKQFIEQKKKESERTKRGFGSSSRLPPTQTLTQRSGFFFYTVDEENKEPKQ